MNDPATPATLYNAMLDALGELQADAMKRPSPVLIAGIIAQQHEQEDIDGKAGVTATAQAARGFDHEGCAPETKWQISHDEAASIAHTLLHDRGLSTDQPALRLLLVLLRALTFTPDLGAREGVYLAVKGLAMQYLEAPEAALEQTCNETLAAVRGARPRKVSGARERR
jgi:hypothetical protein